MILLLLRPSLRRLADLRTIAVGAPLLLLLFLVGTLVRAAGTSRPADRVLTGLFAMLVLPWGLAVLVRRSLGAPSLGAAAAPLVALGAPPRRAAAALVAPAIVAAGVLGALGALALAAGAHGTLAGGALGDLARTAQVALLGGLAYGAYFALGSAAGRFGILGLFVVDALATQSVSGLATPGALVRALLGGQALLGLGPRASSLVLLAQTLAYAAAAVLVTRRRAR